MAERSELEDADVAALASAFGAGKVQTWWSIPAGTINSNFGLKTEGGRYFLRINEGKREEDVRYEAALVSELARAGVPVPAPFDSTAGEPFARLRGELASLFPWIEGGHRARGQVSERDAEAVGAALALLHGAGRPIAERFERRGIYTFDDIVRRFEGLRGLSDPELEPALDVVGEEIPWLRARAPAREAAAQGVIHGDLFRDNVVFRGERLVALIDFEQASTGTLVYDLAVCLNAWCFDEDVEPVLARALLGAYRTKRELSAPDREALYVELRAAAMRFAVTRITDVYLAGVRDPDKDFRRYLRRLVRWRSLGPDAIAAWLSPGA